MDRDYADSRASSETVYVDVDPTTDPIRSVERDRIVAEYGQVAALLVSERQTQFRVAIAALSGQQRERVPQDLLVSELPTVRTMAVEPTLHDNIAVIITDLDDSSNVAVKLQVVDWTYSGSYLKHARTVQPRKMRSKKKSKNEPIIEEEVPIKPFGPHPPYYSCTPANVSIARFTGIDPNSLDFIAFADNPLLNPRTLARDFSSFTWQHLEDPDLTAFYVELARRLCYTPNNPISRKALDANLPRRLRVDRRVFERPQYFGEPFEEFAQSFSRQSLWRDPVEWVGFEPPDVTTLRSQLLEEAMAALYREFHGPILRHVAQCARFFCRRCFVFFCLRHEIPWETLDPDCIEARAEPAANVGPCQPPELCFKTQGNWGEDSLMEDAHIKNILDDIYKLDPNASPCDVAVISRVSCVRVGRYRQQMMEHSTTTTLVGDTSRGATPTWVTSKSRKRSPWVDLEQLVDMQREQTAAADFIPVPPCMHKGPCEVADICNCHKYQQHCTSACLCSQDCGMRWRGCADVCDKRQGECLDSQGCPCARKSKECEPSLCHPRKGKRKRAPLKCLNIFIQMARSAKMHIKRGKYGLGAFTAQDIEVGQYIGEYNGIVSAETHNTQLTPAPVMDLTGFNYVFDLNADPDGEHEVSIDSFAIGNETRYVNHSLKPNIKAQTMFVAGEHRIGYWASCNIGRNKELFLNYGTGFFNTTVTVFAVSLQNKLDMDVWLIGRVETGTDEVIGGPIHSNQTKIYTVAEVCGDEDCVQFGVEIPKDGADPDRRHYTTLYQPSRDEERQTLHLIAWYDGEKVKVTPSPDSLDDI